MGTLLTDRCRGSEQDSEQEGVRHQEKRHEHGGNEIRGTLQARCNSRAITLNPRRTLIPNTTWGCIIGSVRMRRVDEAPTCHRTAATTKLSECQMMYVILLNEKRLPLGGGEKKPSRAVENPSTILLVGERSRHGQRAGHTREQRNCSPTPFLLVPSGDVLGHPADVRSQRLQKWSACAARSSGHLGRERSHGTPAGDIVAVPDIEVGVDERLAAVETRRRLVFRRGIT